MTGYAAELSFAGELADEAREIGLRYFRGEFTVERKADRTPVTDADLAIEKALRDRLAERFPDDAVLGEEGGLQGDADRVWVLDPIDGTKNFAAGIQVWATLIALMEGGDPVVGVIGAAALGERYAAARGSGATLNDEPIHVSKQGDLSESLVCTSGTKEWLTGPFSRAHREIVAASGRTRAFGDFWGHALVARGSAEAMLEPALRTWDWAALAPIVTEAGGRMTALDGGPLVDHGSTFSSNGLLHDELVARFRSKP